MSALPNSGPPGPDVAAREHVRAVTRAAGSSFYLGMRVLPEDRRDAMFAIYAFCRAVDDIADGDAPDSAKLQALEVWRERIDGMYAGRPSDDPVVRALTPAVQAYGLDRADFLAVIDGMEMDTGVGMCAPTWERLRLYCDRVAGAVGLLSIRIFGDASDAARDFALTLGTALQLTNILRDLKDDARMGRLYLPAEELDAAGIAARTPDGVLADPALGVACAGVAARAKDSYAEAARLLGQCDARALRPAVVMMKLYGRVLDRLIASGWRDLDEEPGVPRIEKLWITLRYGLL